MRIIECDTYEEAVKRAYTELKNGRMVGINKARGSKKWTVKILARRQR